MLEEITQIWSVEDSERRELENGFEWLPGSHSVQVRISRHVERPDRIRIWIMTDYLRSVPVENVDFVRRVGLMSEFLCSGYSLVYPPLDVWKEYFDNHPAELRLFSSAYVDENLAGGLPRFLAQMAIMQPIEAEVRSTAALEVFGGGEPAYADGDKKDRISGMLFIARDVFAPEGRKASKWIGCEEFRQFADEYANNDACLGFGDENGMTLETPFGANSALIRFRTDQPHPQLGSGLLVNILICSYESFDAACAEAAGLNYMEAIRWTDVPQLGSWYPDVTRGEEAHLAHSCFIPNALFGPGLVVNLALWSIARVQWLRRTRYPELEDKTMTEILSSRLGLYG